MFRVHAPSLRTMEVCRSHSLALLPPLRRVTGSIHGGVSHENIICNSCIGDAAEFVCSRSIRLLARLLRCLRSGSALPCVRSVPPYAAYYGAYAQAPYFRTPGFYDLYGRLSPYPYSVYDIRGRYIGSDPDPRVRDQLRRDPPGAY
jgi:hypothetical protein